MSSYIKPDQMFDPNVSSIHELFERNTFQIPVYQRPYSWREQEAGEFIDDIIENFNNKTQLFVGTIYIKESQSHLKWGLYATDYEVIDGQQRFTTLALILLSLYVILKGIDKYKELSVEIDDLKNALWKKGNSDMPLLQSGSIENKILKSLFNTAYQNPDNYKNRLNSLSIDQELNVIEKNLIDVARYLYKRFESFVGDSSAAARGIDGIVSFVLYQISAISIIVKESNQRVFNIFESINSKGKQLDQIDLIKTHIFSQIPVDESQIYLERWGRLIIKTKNNLEDYLWVYIKSFIKYYKGNVSLKLFKNLIKNEDLNTFYGISRGQPNYCLVLKALIDDLINKLDCYESLINVESFKSIVTDDKNVLLQFQIFSFQEYEQCRPLFLKTIYEFMQSSRDAKEKAKLTEIFKCSNSFLIELQSLTGKQSNYSVAGFESIMNFNYGRYRLDLNFIRQKVTNELLAQGIDEEEIRKKLLALNGFRNSIGKTLLIVAESYHDNFFSADKANQLLMHEKLSIDHLLPQKPDESADFVYGRRKIDNNDKNDLLVLRNDADFPNNIYDGMLYSEFENLILNKLGNLCLLERDSNSSKSNDSVPYMKFYRDITDRQGKLIDKVINADVLYIPAPLNNQEDIDFSSKLLDWKDPTSSIGRKFKLVNIFGKKIEVDGTKETLEKIFSELYHYNPKDFYKLRVLGVETHPFISQDQGDLRSPRKIESSLWFIETHNDNSSNVKRIIRALELFNISLDEVEIFYE